MLWPVLGTVKYWTSFLLDTTLPCWSCDNIENDAKPSLSCRLPLSALLVVSLVNLASITGDWTCQLCQDRDVGYCRGSQVVPFTDTIARMTAYAVCLFSAPSGGWPGLSFDASSYLPLRRDVHLGCHWPPHGAPGIRGFSTQVALIQSDHLLRIAIEIRDDPDFSSVVQFLHAMLGRQAGSLSDI